MKELSDKIKNKIVEECFEDVCEDAQKEETGAFKGFVNQVIKPRVCLLQDRSVVVIDKKHKLSSTNIFKKGRINNCYDSISLFSLIELLQHI